jgi:hypothetical protein
MRRREIRMIAAIALVAGLLAGCGGGSKDKAATQVKGKDLSGETETGMKLRVETFVAPSSDPDLAAVEAYRAAGKFAQADYHRVTADNSKGKVVDRGRTVDFAKDQNALSTGGSVEASFMCDVLHFEWIPAPDASAKTLATYKALLSKLCTNGPPKADGIAPGKTQTYYLITQGSFATRGLATMRVFGPEGQELTPRT